MAPRRYFRWVPPNPNKQNRVKAFRSGKFQVKLQDSIADIEMWFCEYFGSRPISIWHIQTNGETPVRSSYLRVKSSDRICYWRLAKHYKVFPFLQFQEVELKDYLTPKNIEILHGYKNFHLPYKEQIRFVLPSRTICFKWLLCFCSFSLGDIGAGKTEMCSAMCPSAGLIHSFTPLPNWNPSSANLESTFQDFWLP